MTQDYKHGHESPRVAGHGDAGDRVTRRPGDDVMSHESSLVTRPFIEN